MSRDPRTSRALGAFERAQVLTGEHSPFNLVVALRLTGTLRGETLRRALDEIQARHALLRARLAGSRGRRRFVLEESPPIPLRSVERRDAESWQRAVEDELLVPMTQAAPLVRCTRVPSAGEDDSELLLTFHHAIVDGVAALHVVRQIVALAGGGEPPGRPERSLPPSADRLFPRPHRAPWRWPASAAYLARQLADEAAHRWRTRGRAPAVPRGPFRCRVLSTALDEEATRDLVRATRRQRVGLVSALDAALLLAVTARRHGGRAGRYRYFAFPVLRPYLRPPVADDVVASYLTTLRLSLPLAPGTAFWPTVARIHRQIDTAVKGGERFLASCSSPFSMRMLLRQDRQRIGTAALSYAGATPVAASPGAPFAVGGLHAFVGHFPRGPEYAAQTRIFRRRLCLDVVYLDVDMDRDEALAIADDMRRLLLDAPRQTGAGR